LLLFDAGNECSATYACLTMCVTQSLTSPVSTAKLQDCVVVIDNAALFIICRLGEHLAKLEYANNKCNKTLDLSSAGTVLLYERDEWVHWCMHNV